jgi:hypothetical protein
MELEYNTVSRRLAIMMAEEDAIAAAPEEMLSEVAEVMPRNLKVSRSACACVLAAHVAHCSLLWCLLLAAHFARCLLLCLLLALLAAAAVYCELQVIMEAQARKKAEAEAEAMAVARAEVEAQRPKERCLVCTEREPNMLSIVCQRLLVCSTCSRLLTHCVHCNVPTQFVLVHRN